MDCTTGSPAGPVLCDTHNLDFGRTLTKSLFKMRIDVNTWSIIYSSKDTQLAEKLHENLKSDNVSLQYLTFIFH